MRPPAFFINALERDQDGNLWVGARAKKKSQARSQATNSPV